MRHGSLFSGIGGFDLAAQWMGWENSFHCEWSPFCQRVLKHYWPNAISYGDIDATDFTIWRGKIDVLSGGFPCQPYSISGKRKGKADARHKWPQFRRAIREIKPPWVVGENVRGIVSWNGGMVFEEVQAELEAEGYEVQPFILPAAGVQAPHERQRVWFAAYSAHNGHCNRPSKVGRETQEAKGTEHGQEWNEILRKRNRRNTERVGTTGTSANTHSERFTDGDEVGGALSDFEKRIYHNGEVNGLGGVGFASDTNGERLSGQKYGRKESGWFTETCQVNEWQTFPTVSPLRSGDDGLSGRLDGITLSKLRTESIKAGGNAIVPQVAYQLFKAIEAYEEM